MEAIRSIPTSLPEGIAPTYAALLPNLIANESKIQSQYDHRETHSYGSDPRQELDIYYPHTYDDNTPVLIFLFGGGFFMGDKQHPQFPNLIYANLGAYFCDKGFITIIANYRLSKGPGNPDGNGRYPSGGEDTVEAIKWATANLGKQRPVFLMGNSAGAVHVMTFLFEPSLLKSVDAKVAGAVLLAPPCHQRKAPDERKPVNAAYYGDDESGERNSPISLMNRNGVVSIPLLSMVGELDEAGIIGSSADFKKEYLEKGGKLDEIILYGHNHISPIPALGGTDAEGNKWGDDAATWMHDQLK
jgi:alpha/beta superfamily hydrolase